MRRVGQARVGLLGTVRTDWSDRNNALAELITSAMDASDVDRVRVAPAGRQAIREILTTRSGADVRGAALTRILMLSRRNPCLPWNSPATTRAGSSLTEIMQAPRSRCGGWRSSASAPCRQGHAICSWSRPSPAVREATTVVGL